MCARPLTPCCNTLSLASQGHPASSRSSYSQTLLDTVFECLIIKNLLFHQLKMQTDRRTDRQADRPAGD